MEPGGVYGALSRLERRGWVRPLAAGERHWDCGSVGIRRSRPGSLVMADNRLATAEVPTCCRPGH